MKYLFILLVFCGFSLFAQENKPIAEKIAEHHRANDRFVPYNFFTENTSSEKQNEFREYASDAVVLDLNSEELQRLMDEHPETIEFTFPYKEAQITVELFKKNILTEGFSAVDQNSKSITYRPGIYYRGIVKNDASSIVAFSFFDNEVAGVASVLGTGNVVVGKAKNSDEFLSYTEHTLTTENTFKCMVDEMAENQKMEFSQGETGNKMQAAIPNCVRVYYEVAYQPYLNNGADETTTLNWITAVHNNIATLYANDNIQVALSSVMIWTEQDPFIYDYNANLNLFRSFRLAFNGDLAHLVNSPSTTSVAYLNSLCGQNRYAYSGINLYYGEVPTYSWTIMAMTHEMGHALGSPHTHACAWNGNGTAIDGCGPAAGFGEGCDAALPASGTIMSYCHLVPSVGINFANGFGSQPAQLIRTTIAGKTCLGTDCVNSCVFSVNDISFSNVTQTSATVHIDDQVSSNWNYRVYPVELWGSNWNSVGTNDFDISNLEPNSYYVVEVRNICTMGTSVGTSLVRLLLTDGDYCGGDLFVDSGGEDGNYIDGRHVFVKTFYPQGNGTLTLTFSDFDLENGYDFMNIYDGENTDAPVFANGEDLTGSTIPGPFSSTSSNGAITVEFAADDYMTGAGWEASITCLLGVEDFQNTNEILVYPNPSNSVVNIEAKLPLQQIAVYDLMGRLVKQKSNLNATKTQLQLTGMENGVYFVEIQSNNKSQTIKLIKK